MIVNCDIGERGADHPVDLALMKHIGLANIACGGHAGDMDSIKVFCAQARGNNVKIAAHLSYPDRENFGRKSMEISQEDLESTLSDQLALIRLVEPVERVKLHGAIYNDCNVNEELAAFVAGWMHENGVTEVVTPFDSALADEARKLGLSVFSEAFAERRYSKDSASGRLVLVPRALEYASIHELDEAVAHAKRIIEDQQVTLYIETADGTQEEEAAIEAQTICIHSDSPISLELAQSLAVL